MLLVHNDDYGRGQGGRTLFVTLKPGEMTCINGNGSQLVYFIGGAVGGGGGGSSSGS